MAYNDGCSIPYKLRYKLCLSSMKPTIYLCLAWKMSCASITHSSKMGSLWWKSDWQEKLLNQNVALLPSASSHFQFLHHSDKVLSQQGAQRWMVLSSFDIHHPIPQFLWYSSNVSLFPAGHWQACNFIELLSNFKSYFLLSNSSKYRRRRQDATKLYLGWI